MSLAILAATAAAGHLSYTDLNLSPVALNLGIFQIRWYSLAYIAGILVGWWYLTKLIDQPGAPMARRHADDFVFYATLGIILGGRIGYIIFYGESPGPGEPALWATPLQWFKLWDGGMSFHGGAFGVVIAIWWLARRNNLSMLRFLDYVACCGPFGLFFGRIANFVNGELWGRPTDEPWGIIFQNTMSNGLPEPARHPSQLYEAGLEGIVLFAILSFLFWRTQARYKPGLLLGVFLVGYGAARFLVEYFRVPDAQLGILPWGISMGQTLSAPMILVGLYFIMTANGRRVRVEPIAGDASVA
ncbi:prolipoprotein diacylglyceryl transferase [Sphingomonas crusticola]|uniref:prolipoprotein diacylglyceryl transferase n=1 Tax=Sphingomonas crusticola TaxID=1697973 RepID=UPI000E261FDB|nr:prolipoprotein diacylglyceryl transferase [Sphingomonas crusticola]